MAENKFSSDEAMARCLPMSKLQSVLSGKWKILILWYIAFYEVQRFNELQRRLEGITQSTLAKQLKELESDMFIHKEIFKEVPLRVEYTLTEVGMSFLPVLTHMVQWSTEHLCPEGYESPFPEKLAAENAKRIQAPGSAKIPAPAAARRTSRHRA